MDEKKSLSEQLDLLTKQNEELIKQKKTKGFKLPFFARLSRNNVKKGYATIAYIRDNKEIEFMKAPIKQGTVIIDDIPYMAMTDFMLSHKGKPFLIIPSWNLKPFSPRENFLEAEEKKTLSAGWRYLFSRMKTEVYQEAKKKFGGSWIWWILLLAVGGGILYFVLTNNIKII
jgi:hypothetical protein